MPWIALWFRAEVSPRAGRSDKRLFQSSQCGVTRTLARVAAPEQKLEIRVCLMLARSQFLHLLTCGEGHIPPSPREQWVLRKLERLWLTEHYEMSL